MTSQTYALAHMGDLGLYKRLCYSIKYPICFKYERKPPCLEDMKYKEFRYHSYRNFCGKGLLRDSAYLQMKTLVIVVACMHNHVSPQFRERTQPTLQK